MSWAIAGAAILGFMVGGALGVIITAALAGARIADMENAYLRAMRVRDENAREG